MTDSHELKSPILIRMAERYQEDPGYFEGLDDSGFYEEIDYAAGSSFDGRELAAGPARELEVEARLMMARLDTGWFADAGGCSPQGRYSLDPRPPSFRIENWFLPSGLGTKPLGALWSSSFLPNGSVTWEHRESAEFGSGRTLYLMTFDKAEAAVYSIDSLADFRELVTRYPLRRDGVVHVNWQAVRTDWHGVRVTAKGLVTAQDIPVDTPEGPARLCSWDAESTAWLRRPPGLGFQRWERDERAVIASGVQ